MPQLWGNTVCMHTLREQEKTEGAPGIEFIVSAAVVKLYYCFMCLVFSNLKFMEKKNIMNPYISLSFIPNLWL